MLKTPRFVAVPAKDRYGYWVVVDTWNGRHAAVFVDRDIADTFAKGATWLSEHP